MYIENFKKIYSTNLHTMSTVYEIGPDNMAIAPNAYVMRLTPKIGVSNKSFTIVITILDNRIVSGIYVDGQWNPIEIFDMSRMDLRSMDLFKKLLSQKINNHE